MMLTAEQFKLEYPEFSGDQVDSALLEASLIVPSYDVYTDKLVGLYTAHLLQLQKRTGANGVVIGQIKTKTVDDVSITYDNGKDAGEFWKLTLYGQRYKAMLDAIAEKNRTIVASFAVSKRNACEN